MKPQVRVGVGVVVWREQKLLLGKRIHSHGDGCWALPGGHLEFGETIEQCAIRELKEETNLDIDSSRELCFSNDIFEDQNKHYITILVEGIAARGEALLMEPDKCESWQWFSLDQLPEPLFLPLKNILEHTPEVLGAPKSGNRPSSDPEL